MKIVLEQVELEQVIRQHIQDSFPALGTAECEIKIVNGRGENGTSVEIEIPATGKKVAISVPTKRAVTPEPVKEIEPEEEEEKEVGGATEEKAIVDKAPIEEADTDLASIFSRKG